MRVWCPRGLFRITYSAFRRNKSSPVDRSRVTFLLYPGERKKMIYIYVPCFVFLTKYVNRQSRVIPIFSKSKYFDTFSFIEVINMSTSYLIKERKSHLDFIRWTCVHFFFLNTCLFFYYKFIFPNNLFLIIGHRV